MRKFSEKELGVFRLCYAFLALFIGVLAVLYLLDVLPFFWMLTLILALGVLLHILLIILYTVRHKTVLRFIAAVLGLFYLAALVYFNIS